ncbi:hypothetical protein [Ornithinibacillus sp. 179-J 7C1 HS]|uniref:hypothetical protein n=1 Tax=Ornithinibacillus sp. 179-J 7C1 HS TaxID=3142384 RepID=UPI0039A2C3B0
MNKNTGFILGSLFVLTGGVIYTIERLSSNIYWLGQINSGAYPPTPENSVPDNFFTWSFLLIGIVLLIYSYMKAKP